MNTDKPFNAKVAAWKLVAALAENPEETGVSHICRLGPLADMIQAALEEAYAEGARRAIDNDGTQPSPKSDTSGEAR